MKKKELELRRRNRSEQLKRNFVETEARRKKCAESFRRKLKAEAPGSGATHESLIQMATTLHVQITEESRAYLAGRLSAPALARLQLARAQFIRTLKALGVVRESGAGGAQDERSAAIPTPPSGATAEERAAWSRQYVDAILEETVPE